MAASLKELLKELPARKLKISCSEEHLARISLSIIKWRTLAPFLGLTEAEEEEIARDYHDTATQRIAMLRSWKGKYGSSATYKKLCRVFWELDRRDLVEVVCRLLSGSESSSDEDAGTLTDQLSTQLHSQDQMKPCLGQPVALNPAPSLPPIVATSTQSLQVAQSPWQPVSIPLLTSQQQPPSATTAIETYAFYLKFDVYLRQKFPTYGKWPPNPTKKFINLALIKKQMMSKEEMDHFTRQTVRGNINDIVHEKESISIEEIGKAKGNTLPKCILVEGAPGVGKSTFAWKLCRKWSKGKLLQQYRLVVLLQLRDKRVREAKSVSDLFYYYNCQIQQTVVESIQATGGRGVLLLFEGYDELPVKLRTSSSMFLEVIKGQELPAATILITSRPSASGPLYEECRDYIAQHVEIMGFTQENIKTYLESTIGHNPSLLQGLQQYLKHYPHIRSMLYIPLNCAIVVEVYRVNKRDKCLIPKTWTDLYSSLLRSLLLRYLDDHPVHQKQSWKSNSFRDLPTDVYQQLCELGRIAYEGIPQDQQVIFSDLPSDFSSLGLMQCVPQLYVDELATESFNFLHLTLQEYMAALYLSEQPVEKQIEIFQKNLQPLLAWPWFDVHQDYYKLNNHFQIMLRFLSGLRKFVGYSISSITSLLTDHEHDIIPAGSDSISRIPISLDGLHWIFEAQNTNTVCKAIEMSVVTVKLPYTVTPFDCFVLGYCVSHTNCPWEVDLSYCGIGDEGMEMFIQGAVEDEAKHSGYISEMNFRGNGITSAGLNQLLKIPELLRMRQLILSDNRLGRGGVVSLLKSPLVDDLEELTLDSTEIGEEDCYALGKLLSSSQTLQMISIRYNALPSEAVESIIVGIKHHKVKYLDMKGSWFNCQNCISLASVTQPPRHLHLANCHIDDDGAIELARLITLNTVTSLYLRGNPIGVKGATVIAEKLPQNKSLRELDLRQESIGLEGAQKLFDSLTQNSTLEKLWLPLQYRSSVHTSEVYRSVEDRIKWRGGLQPLHCQEKDVVMPRDHTHPPHPPWLSNLPLLHVMGPSREPASESKTEDGSEEEYIITDPGKGHQRHLKLMSHHHHKYVPELRELSEPEEDPKSKDGSNSKKESGSDSTNQVPLTESVPGAVHTNVPPPALLEDSVDLLDSEVEEWETPPTSPTHLCSATFPNPGTT